MDSALNLKPTNDFAEFLGAFVGDGWIPKAENALFILGHPIDDADYYTGYFYPLACTINSDIKLRDYPYWGVSGVSVYQTNFVKNLLDYGFTTGKKARITSFPDWVLQNTEFRLAALRGVFDTDGNFCCKKCYGKYDNPFRRKFHCQPQISITTSSHALAIQLQNILLSNGFHPEELRINYVKPSAEPSYVIRLSRLNEIYDWFETFELSKNPKHLNKFLIWKKYGFYPPKISDQQRKDILSERLDPYSFY